MEKTANAKPTKPTQELATEILALLAEGQPLRRICKDDRFPSIGTFYRWLGADAELAKRYAHAREEQADTYADEIAEIADENPQTVPIYDGDGNVIEIKIDTAFEAWRKNRIDARKWIAAKLKPKSYGEKLTQEHSGPNGGDIPFAIVERKIIDPKGGAK